MGQHTIWTIRSVLAWSVSWLGTLGIDSPRLDSELLLADALGLRRLDLFLDPDRPLQGAELAAYKTVLKRRAAREPVAYILGRRGFWTLELAVGPGVLIPRPETERLVEAVLERFPDRNAPLDILDVGVGSGAILYSLLREYPHANGLGVDRSPEALAYARRNATDLGLLERARLVEGDYCAPLLPTDTFDVIVANPPYIDPVELAGLAPEVAQWEPTLALDGGVHGLEGYQRLVPQAVAHLRPMAVLLVEIGLTQGAAVSAIFAAAGLTDMAILNDHGRRPRVVAGRSAP